MKKIIFINAVNEVRRENAFSCLADTNIQRIYKSFQEFKDIPDFSRVVDVKDIRENAFSLSLPLYIKLERNDRGINGKSSKEISLEESLLEWHENSNKLKQAFVSMVRGLECLNLEGNDD